MDALKKSIGSAILMVRLILPVLFVLEILKYFQLITPLSVLLSPVIHLLELPSEFSIVWVVGLLTGVYGAVASFFYIVSSPENYSVAQVSVLSALILIAHALPIEAKISQRLGLGYWRAIFFRVVLSVVFALLIKYTLGYFDLLQNKIHLIPQIIEPQSTDVTAILINPIVMCIKISLIIIVLHLGIAFLKRIHLIDYIELLLKPIAYFLRVDHKLSSSLLVGIVLGISYGGSLLIKDMEETQIVDQNEKRKVVYLLNILHSLIEDTALVLLIGTDIFVVLLGRVLFTLMVMLLIDAYSKRMCARQQEA